MIQAWASPHRRTIRSARLERGQSLVEMAISSVALTFLLLGLLDIGRLYFIYIAMEDAAGEAAVYLSINPGCPTAASGSACADPKNATYRAKNAASGYFKVFQWDDTTSLTVTRPPAYATGTTVYVEISHSFDLLFPVIPQIVGMESITITSEASHVIVSE